MSFDTDFKKRFFIQSWKQTGWRSVIDLLGHFFGCHFYWKNHVFPTQIVCFGLSGGHSNIQSADQETSFIFWQKLQNHSLKKSSRATKTQLAFCSSNLSKETPNLQGWIQLLHLWIYKNFLDVSSENFHDTIYRSVIRKVCRDP